MADIRTYQGNLSTSGREMYGRSYDYDSDRVLRKPEAMVRDQPITDKNKPKLVAMDAALRNITMYLSSRHNGRFHAIWFMSAKEHEVARTFVCEWRNPEPIVILKPRVVSLRDVFDHIEQHTVYMPAIALDGDQDK